MEQEEQKVCKSKGEIIEMFEIYRRVTDEFNETRDKLREMRELTSLAPIGFITNKARTLIFSSKVMLAPSMINELQSKFTSELGIKCIILNKEIELTSVIEE